MRAPVLAAALAAAASLVARPAAAQTRVAAAAVPPAAPLAAAPAADRVPDAAAARARAAVLPVARYRIHNAGTAFPASLVVADSAGHLVATYRVPGDTAARPMFVAAEGANLVLCAETAAGPLTIVLEGQNDPAARGRSFTGRWQRGEAEGQLVGRVQR